MELQKVPIRTSLNRQIGIAGGERLPVILSLFISVYFGFAITMGRGLFLGILIGFAIWTSIMFILVRMGSEDMQMSTVFWRHRKYRPFYSAHGRLDASPMPIIKDFVK